MMIKNLSLAKYFSHTIQPFIQPYTNYRTKELKNFIKSNTSYKGQYNEEGMQLFKQRHLNAKMKPLIANKGLGVSDIGLGTYKGSIDQSDDIVQFNAIIDSVLSGVNVIDTCANFRGGRSQIILGAALRYLIEIKMYDRKNFLLMSKAGYVRDKLPSQLNLETINGHCVHPAYLQQSLNQSLQTIGIQKLDVFYLNNFAECQLEVLGKDKFMSKLAKAFQFLQKMRKENKISNYGLCSWESFRVAPQNKQHLNLREIVELADKVCGKNNGFKFTQVPINIMMPQIFAEKNQQFGSFLETAQALKINVISCSPILSGTLINIPLPTNKLSCRHNGAKHIQLIRSIPSSSLACTLIGQKANRHVKKNLEAVSVPSLDEDQWFDLFMPAQKIGEKVA